MNSLKRIFINVAITILAAVIWDIPAGAALNVPLTVNNPLGQALTRQPVTFGIPIPRNQNLLTVRALRLTDSVGTAIPAQFTVLARWGGGPDEVSAAIKWILIDFQASVPAGSTAVYRLAGGGPGPAPDSPLVVTDGAEAVTIQTGAGDYQISKTDGRLSGPGLSAPMTGQISSGAVMYTTSGTVTVSIELTGSMRSCVKVTGNYRDGRGAAILGYTSRFWFYSGQALVRLFHTLENNNLDPLGDSEQLTTFNIGSSNSVDVTDCSLLLDTSLTGDLSYSVGGETDIPGGSLTGNVVLYQDSSGADSWNHFITMTDWDETPLDTSPRMQSYVSFRGYRLTMGGDMVSQGHQARGWLTLTNGDQSLSVGVRDFWRNFPKALRSRTSGRIEVGLFPNEFGGGGYSFNLRAGEHKTHEVVIGFNRGSPEADLTALSAVASGRWYVDSQALGTTAMPDTSDWPDHEEYLSCQLDPAPDYPDYWDTYHSLLLAIEQTDFYGIYDYGDWPVDYEGYGVAPINCKYDMGQGAFIQWVRSEDSRWFVLAEALGRHIADIDIMHNLHTPRHWGDGIAFGHSAHDEEGFVNPHRNSNSGSPDTAYGMGGLLLTYYLTGYEKALDSAGELADCIEFRIRNEQFLCSYFPGGCNGTGNVIFNDGLYNDSSRPLANSLYILVQACRAFAEPRFFETADAIVDFGRASNQPYINGPTGAGDFVKPWMLSLFTRALADYVRVNDEFGRPDTQGAKASLVSYADFLHTYPWIPLSSLSTGPRATLPYEWYFDNRPNQEELVSNWLLLSADGMAAAYQVGGNKQYLNWAATLFRTGSHDPFFLDDERLVYSQTKQTINSITFGNVFLSVWAGDNRSIMPCLSILLLP